MKKFIVFILLTLALALDFFYYKFYIPNKDSINKKDSSNVVEDDINKSSTEKPNDIQSEPKDTIEEIYDIKGVSINIKGKSWDNMLESRKKQVDLAKKYPNSVFTNGITTKKQIALTYDYGPDPGLTDRLQNILKNKNVKATFFLLGEKVKANPKIVKRIFDEGHLPMNHTYSHKELTKLSLDKAKKEVLDTENLIANLTGKKPNIIRPPYGDINSKLIDDYFDKENYKIALWSIDTLDWSQKEATNIVKNVEDNVRNGDVILMHTSATDETLKATETIIDDLRAKGYEFVTIDKILNVPAYR